MIIKYTTKLIVCIFERSSVHVKYKKKYLPVMVMMSSMSNNFLERERVFFFFFF